MSFHEGDREEGEDGGDDGGDDGPGDEVCALDGGFVGGVSSFVVSDDIFGDNDGIIDEDADDDDEAEHGEEVEGDACESHHDECAHEGDDHADDDPEADAPVEEEKENEEDEACAEGCVAHEEMEAADDEAGEVGGDGDCAGELFDVCTGDAKGVGALFVGFFVGGGDEAEELVGFGEGEGFVLEACGVCLDEFGHFDGVLVADLIDGERDGGLAVETGADIDIDKAVRDGGDVGESEDLALALGFDDDFADIGCAFVGAGCADADIGCG